MVLGCESDPSAHKPCVLGVASPTSLLTCQHRSSEPFAGSSCREALEATLPSTAWGWAQSKAPSEDTVGPRLEAFLSPRGGAGRTGRARRPQ